jgi:3-oxoacyl-(acyl-carrier-protein) synthase
MTRRRAKITGLGFVTPAGIGIEDFSAGIRAAKSFVREISRFPKEAGPFVGAEIANCEFEKVQGSATLGKVPRHTQLGLLAARLAMEDAGLGEKGLSGTSSVVATGTSLMDSDIINRAIENVVRKGPRFATPRVVFQSSVASISAAIGEMSGANRTVTVQSACCSGVDAIGHAVRMIEQGEVSIALCGGTEAPLFYHPLLELRAAGLSPASAENPEKICRPFDLWRTTGVIGEGACMMILEPEESPREGYAIISGYASAADSHSGAGSGMFLAIRGALANANLDCDHVDLINAWGPGHKEIDASEAHVINSVFGSRTREMPAFSVKGAIGNPFAAAGAIQVGLSALCIRDAWVPPTVNWAASDPACSLNLSSASRVTPVGSVLVNSHGLSGTNASLVVVRCR